MPDATTRLHNYLTRNCGTTYGPARLTPESAMSFLGEFLPIVATDDAFLATGSHGSRLASTACLLISRNVAIVLFGRR